MAGCIFASSQKFKAIFMCFTIKWQPSQKKPPWGGFLKTISNKYLVNMSGSNRFINFLN